MPYILAPKSETDYQYLLYYTTINCIHTGTHILIACSKSLNRLLNGCAVGFAGNLSREPKHTNLERKWEKINLKLS